MSDDTRPAVSPASREATTWRRMLDWLRVMDEAMNTSYDEIQDRRILALETEVALLRETLDASCGDNTVVNDQGSAG